MISLILLFIIVAVATANGTSMMTAEKWAYLNEIKMNAEQFEKWQRAHVNWYVQAVHSLVGLVGRDLYPSLPSYYQRRLRDCLRKLNANDLEIVTPAAKCVSSAIPFEQRFATLTKSRPDASNRIDIRKKEDVKSERHWIGSFRQQRAVNETCLRNNNFRFYGPKKVRRRRGARLAEIQSSPETSGNNFHKSKRFWRYAPKNRNRLRMKLSSRNKVARKMPRLLNSEGSRPLVAVSRYLTKTFRKISGKERKWSWKETFRRLKRLHRTVTVLNRRHDQSHELMKSGPLVRLYNSITSETGESGRKGENSIDIELADAKRVYELMESSPRVARALGRMNSAQKTSLSWLSPRLAPLFPKLQQRPTVLSPEIFSFFTADDKSQYNFASIPDILNTIGIQEKEEALMEFVLEVSGAREGLEEVLSLLDKEDIDENEVDRDVAESGRRVSAAWIRVIDSFTRRQKDQMRDKGYSFLNLHQLQTFYGDKGIYNNTEFSNPMTDYAALSEDSQQKLMRQTVQRLAGTGTRGKRSAARLNVLNPLVLAPFQLEPVTLVGIVLGPVILSPFTFSPITLSPAVLSPLILSPYIFSPFILSPYVLAPYILSPYVLGPYILSPFALSPFILSPYVLSPLILSPLTLSPVILSPYVLSPVILSPSHLSGNILSPALLSPQVLSPSALAADVLSPTILS